MFKFLKQIFNKKENFPYKDLLKKYSIQDINFMSIDKKFIILKHSERCIVSRTIMKDFMKFYNANQNRFYFIVVDVIDNRILSNSISEYYKIIHQSPQLIVIDNGKSVFFESHNEINFNDIDHNF